jgi:hypothetical protein
LLKLPHREALVARTQFFDIDANNPGIDDKMAVFEETSAGKRKYLPYLMVNILGFKNLTEP